ncbi:MAG: hypothetical protein C4278_00785 [Patescibacteria group bacterium]
MTIEYILIIILALGLIYFIFKKELESLKKQRDIDGLKQITDLFNSLEKNMLEKFKILNEELAQKYELTIQKQEKIIETSGKLEELARNLEMSLLETKTIKEILMGPKTRGQWGEKILEEIISQLPSSFYEKQYRLSNDIVDYVLKLNDQIIPIDVKFPLIKFEEGEDSVKIKKQIINNLKEKIESISRKYILPYKGTVDFAIMYIANEKIFYEILSDKDYEEVWNFAKEKSVFLASPKTFEVLVSSLLLALRRQELSRNIHIILENLNQLDKDLKILEEHFEKSYYQLNQSFKNLMDFSRIFSRFISNFRSLLQVKNKEIKEKILV